MTRTSEPREPRGSLVLSLLIGLTMSAAAVPSQQPGAGPGTVLPPARQGLEPVPLPDLTGLEPTVAEQLQGARDSLATVLAERGPDRQAVADAYGLLGQLYHAYELLPAGRACYLNARSLAPKDVRWPHLLARLEEKAGRLPEALALYREAGRIQPRFLAAVVQEADILHQLGRQDEAWERLQTALAIAPESPAVHDLLGRVALAVEQYDVAVKYLQEAIRLQPDADRLYYSLAMAQRGLGQTEAARSSLARAGTVGVRVADPFLAELEELLQGERVHLIRGKLAFTAGRAQEARAEFERAVAASPQSGRARVNLATTMAELGDVDGAIEQYRAVLELEPENGAANFNLGVLLERRGDLRGALPFLQAAAMANPRDVEVRRELARILEPLGETNQLIRALDEILALDPGDEDSRLRLAQILVDEGRHGEAYSRLEHGYAMDPGRGRTAHALARMLAASPDRAIRNGELALDLAQKVFRARQEVEFGVTVAMALAELGRCAEAAAFQRQLIAAVGELEEPGAEEVVERLGRILPFYDAGPPCRPGDEP